MKPHQPTLSLPKIIAVRHLRVRLDINGDFGQDLSSRIGSNGLHPHDGREGMVQAGHLDAPGPDAEGRPGAAGRDSRHPGSGREREEEPWRGV